MKFYENIIALRKKNNMSQEKLAMKLNVSRQTIYKWETGATYPDMDKLLDIANVFNVSIETLVNGEVEPETISPAEITHNYNVFGIRLGVAIAVIICSVAIKLFISSYNFNNSNLVGILTMLTLIFGSVLTIVLSSVKFAEFKKECKKTNTVYNYSDKDYCTAKNKFITNLVIGIISIFIGTVFNICCSELLEEESKVYGVCILLVLTGFGVFNFVFGGLRFGAYSKGNKDENIADTSTNPTHDITNAIGGILILSAVIIAFIWGFVFKGWLVSWICFPIAIFITGIIKYVFKIRDIRRNDKSL